MKLTLIRILIATALAWAAPATATSKTRIDAPTFGKWSLGCSNSGLCFTSTFIRDQSTWLDLRIVRDWPAAAGPLLRMTANAPLDSDGTIQFRVDGVAVEALPVTQLREIQSSIPVPDGFRPLGGAGFWYPSGPATVTMLNAMAKGATLAIDLPIDGSIVTTAIPLEGIRLALNWLDDRQNRAKTVTAIANPGTEPAQDAPHAIPVLSPDSLPPAVLAAWNTNKLCSGIDPAIFASLDAVAAPMASNSTLYILPCGAPSAYNTPYVAIQSLNGGTARQLYLARMSEQGPLATDLIYNAKWNTKTNELDGLFKGSGVADCGTWSRWTWTGATFVLKQELTRQKCDGQETPISDWSSSWPIKTTDK
ncbi:DUF1176 domain-containing protein [Roseibium algae]|uniref:DUF1176 domain-containing protein n=1 Tax=Roseibium algae TaxID=3123038 RepID=A0ABU8TEW3_9HYPH